MTSVGSVGTEGRGVERRGTGEEASMRAGFRMIGRDMGGTPTCRGEARGCRMRGDWQRDGGDSGEAIFTGLDIGGVEGGTGDDLSVPEEEKEKKEQIRA